MIKLLPIREETLVVAHAWDVVLEKILTEAASMSSEEKIIGWAGGDRFQVMIKPTRIQPFLPVAAGTIEPTSKGSILFLEFKLLPTTRMFLTFWNLLIVLSGVFVSFQFSNILLLLSAAGILLIINAIAWANFYMHVKPLRERILHILE